MPDLELKPHEYGPAGKRVALDNPWLLGFWTIVGLLMIAYVFWHRNEMAGHLDTLILFVGVIAFAVGMLFALLLKRLNLN